MRTDSGVAAPLKTSAAFVAKRKGAATASATYCAAKAAAGEGDGKGGGESESESDNAAAVGALVTKFAQFTEEFAKLGPGSKETPGDGDVSQAARVDAREAVEPRGDDEDEDEGKGDGFRGSTRAPLARALAIRDATRRAAAADSSRAASWTAARSGEEKGGRGGRCVVVGVGVGESEPRQTPSLALLPGLPGLLAFLWCHRLLAGSEEAAEEEGGDEKSRLLAAAAAGLT